MYSLFLEEFGVDGEKPLRATNRRRGHRYDLKKDKVQLVQADTIFEIIELSKDGLKVKLHQNSKTNFEAGQEFTARLFFNKKSHNLNLTVAWVEEEYAGFRIAEMHPDTEKMIHKILHPSQVATSFKKIHTDPPIPCKNWFHSEENADLYIDASFNDKIYKWIVTFDQNVFVCCDHEDTLRSGQIRGDQITDLSQGMEIDENTDQNLMTFAKKVINLWELEVEV